MRFFTKLNDVTPSTASSASSTTATANEATTLPFVAPPVAIRGRYVAPYTATWPSDRSQATMDSSARTGLSHMHARDPRSSTPMYITTTNRASGSRHFWIRTKNTLHTSRGMPQNVPATKATSTSRAAA